MFLSAVIGILIVCMLSFNSGIRLVFEKVNPVVEGGSSGSTLSSTLYTVEPLLVIVSIRRALSPASRAPFLEDKEGSSK